MQGFILNKIPQKNEHAIVEILTPKRIWRLWRFYGMRHSLIQIGKKIDFSIDNDGLFMPRLRNIYGLNFMFESNVQKSLCFGEFCTLFSAHFRGILEVESFYFELLDLAARLMNSQNPYRVLLEMYAKLLHFEGRNPECKTCFLCENQLNSRVSLARSFLFAHEFCLDRAMRYKNVPIRPFANVFSRDRIEEFLRSQSSILLEDSEVMGLYEILKLGI
ncbi:MAG: recombination protein RecO [Helicobacter sp.]|nr:recombination protein RecO [Helicobacter sp.]